MNRRCPRWGAVMSNWRASSSSSSYDFLSSCTTNVVFTDVLTTTCYSNQPASHTALRSRIGRLCGTSERGGACSQNSMWTCNVHKASLPKFVIFYHSIHNTVILLSVQNRPMSSSWYAFNEASHQRITFTMLIVYVVSCFSPDAKYRVKLKPPIPTFQNDRYNLVVYFQNFCNFRSSTVYQPLRASMGYSMHPQPLPRAAYVYITNRLRDDKLWALLASHNLSSQHPTGSRSATVLS